MNNNNLSAIDLYMNRVFKILIVGIPIIALCAGGTFSFIKLLGYYDNLSNVKLILFDVSCVLYFLLGLTLLLRSKDKYGRLRPKVLTISKIFITVLVFVQWNFISYIVPSRDFWAYSVFFVIVVLPFLDHKMVLACEAEVGISTVVSWFATSDGRLLPVSDEHFAPELILRCVLMLLAFIVLWLAVYLIQKHLVAELERIANIDTLTLLKNRRSLDFAADNIIANAEKNGTPFTVFMCDLDDFKLVNDTYGHDCGDAVLKSIADVITRNISSDDYAFRYGGEEMLIVIEAGSEIALKTAERIRANTERNRISYNGQSVGVTMTIGVAEFKPGQTFEQLVKLADENLYRGKDNGKNQVFS